MLTYRFILTDGRMVQKTFFFSQDLTWDGIELDSSKQSIYTWFSISASRYNNMKINKVMLK